jgi:hypothetical protein
MITEEEKKFISGDFLSKEQREAEKTIDWLIGDYKREGRTSLLAYCFIKKALSMKKCKIYVFDHYPTRRATEDLIWVISSIIPSKIRARFMFGPDWILFGGFNEKDKYEG